MSQTSKFDKVSFPGGYDFEDIVVAVAVAEMLHVKSPALGTLEQAIVQRFFEELVHKHPGCMPFRSHEDPYSLRAQELFEERNSLLNSHLKFSWFVLAYWAYGFIAARSGLSIAEFDNLNVFITPVIGALRELGIQVSNQECLDEIDRFIPYNVTAQNVKAAAQLFLSFVHFLHNGALRRREVVTPRLFLPSVFLAFVEADAEEAHNVFTFLTTHGVTIGQRPVEFGPTDRLLVLLSQQAMDSEIFWRSLGDWKQRQAAPMVLCLMPKAELYRKPPVDWRQEVWSWLAGNVAVELGSEVDRYVKLLRALDSPDPKQWWWNKADAVELGLAVDVLGLGLPRPLTIQESSPHVRKPYPYSIDGSLFAACLVASDQAQREKRYYAICLDLMQLRKKANGEPYALPWFVIIYRTWLAFAAKLSGFNYSEQEVAQAEQEMQLSLFALGIGTNGSEVPAFLESFANLPWTNLATTPEAVDERTVAFLCLVYYLSQAALTRGQRMRLQHPYHSAFVSYAREDESFARELVANLEAKGAEIWWDMNSIILGKPLDDSLKSAIGDAQHLLLIATPAAGRSAYVRLEIETAIRCGLRIIPILRDGQMPAELKPLLDQTVDSTEAIIDATHAESAAVQTSVLSRMERSPSAQLQWLQAQQPYQTLSQSLSQTRATQSAKST